MHKICKLTKNEATTSLYLMRRFVYFRMESHTCFFVNYAVLLMCDQTKKKTTTCIETIEGSIVVMTFLLDAVSGMQSI